MKYYYYSEGNQQFGPYTHDELKTKRLKRSTLVWSEGMSEWTPATEIADIKDIIFTEPPPLPVKRTSNASKDNQLGLDLYDLSYRKETEATIVGVILLIIILSIYYSDGILLESEDTFAIFIISNLFIRISVTAWIVSISKRQNRDAVSWGIFAFLSPSIALIIIGLLKKKRLKVVLNLNLTAPEQLVKLLETANKFYSSARYSECIIILNKCIELDNNNLYSIRLRALSYFHLHNYEKAVVDFELLLSSSKDFAEAKYYLGLIAFINHKKPDAITHWQQAYESGYVDAISKLDLYHTFTGKYILSPEQILKKVSTSTDNSKKFDEYEIENIKYINGLVDIDNLKQNDYCVTRVNSYDNGLWLKVACSNKMFHVAIAYYEIKEIRDKTKAKILTIHLFDGIEINLTYINPDELTKELSFLSKRITMVTGKNLLVKL